MRLIENSTAKTGINKRPSEQLNNLLKISPLVLLLLSPIANSKLTIIRVPVDNPTSVATTTARLPATVIAAASTSTISQPTAASSPIATSSMPVSSAPVAPNRAYASTPRTTTASTNSSKSSTNLAASSSTSPKTLMVKEKRTLNAITQPSKAPIQAISTSQAVSAATQDPVPAATQTPSAAIPPNSTTAKTNTTPKASTTAVTPLEILADSPKKMPIENLIIATPNRDIPASLNKNIHMPSITISLKDLFGVLEAYSPVDMTVAREVNDEKTNHIRSIRSVQLRQLLDNALQSDRLTFKTVGQDLLFIYNDDPYSNCLYNRVDTNNFMTSTHVTSDNSTQLSSIRTDNKTINSTLDFIGGFDNQQVYIDSGLLFPIAGRNISEATDSINLRNKNLNQILTVLSYRNGLEYQYVGDNILLITENPNLELCKGFLDKQESRDGLEN